MKILILGKNGQLGWELQRALAPLGTVTALRRGGPDGVDLAAPASLRTQLLALRPDAIVNAAAYTAVDKAESEPALARAVNALKADEQASLRGVGGSGQGGRQAHGLFRIPGGAVPWRRRAKWGSAGEGQFGEGVEQVPHTVQRMRPSHDQGQWHPFESRFLADRKRLHA